MFAILYERSHGSDRWAGGLDRWVCVGPIGGLEPQSVGRWAKSVGLTPKMALSREFQASHGGLEPRNSPEISRFQPRMG